MTSDVGINIEITSKGQGAKRIKRDLDDIATSGNKATSATNQLEKQMGATAKATQLLSRAVVGLMAAYGTGALIRFSDNITALETQLKNVTRGTEDYTRKFESLFKIAQSTGDAFIDLTGNFVRLNSSLPDAIKNTTDLTKVTELLSRGFAASGANAQAAGAVMTQLTQGLAGNFANAAQEINSMIEGTPLLAKIIAEQLGGKAATDLKKFAEEGRLTTESFIAALLASEEAIKAYEIPPTISRSIQRIKNEFVKLGSESGALEGASNGLAKALDTVADNLTNIIKVAGVLIGSTLPILIRQLAVALPAAITATTTAVTALTVAIGANPLGAIAIGASAAVSALFLFRKEIFEALDGVKIFGTDITDIFFTIKNTAIEIFSGLARILALPFKLAYNAINNTVREIQLLANKIPGVSIPVNDFISQTQTIGDTFRANGQIENNIINRTANDIIEFQNRNLKPSGIEQAAKATENVATNVSTATEKLEKMADKVKSGGEVNDAFKDFSNDIERDFAAAFKDAFSGAEGTFKQFISGTKASFMNFLSEIAYQAAARPILLSLGVAGSTVLGGGSANAGGLGSILGGGSGGGFSLGDLGSLAANGFSGLMNGLNTPVFGINSFIGRGINSIGNSLGLVNNSVFAGGGLGPAAPLSTAFTPMAGIAGFGGNLLANALFGSDRGIGASIGGIAGGIGGTAIGASLGTILGVAGGPVGALLGAFAGNAIGGLFGGGSVPSNAADITIGAKKGIFKAGNITSDEASDERLSQIKKAGSSVSNSLNTLISGLGGTLESAPKLVLGATRREPGIAKISGVGEKVFSSFQKAVDFGLNTVLQRSEISGFSSEFEKFFKDTFSKGGSFQNNATAVLKGKKIFDLIEGFEKATEASNPLKDALDSLDKQFADLKEKAIDLKLPVDKLTASYEAQRQAFITGALQPLQEFLDTQALSNTSSLSAVERLSLSRSAFDTNLSAIQRGDLSGLGSITNQANQLLSLGRDVFASGAGFNALESFVRQSISKIGEQLGGEGALNDSIGREITLSNAQQTSIMQQMLVELEELRKENKELRKSMERVGNSLNA